MATTPNLGLYKPSRNDSVEVDVSLAENFDIIDTEVSETIQRMYTAEQKLITVEAAQVTTTQQAQAAVTTADSVKGRLDNVEKDVETLKSSGGGGTGTGTPAFIDGGSFLDTYSSQTSGLDGGEF